MSNFSQKIEVYQGHEKKWLEVMNTVYAPLKITLSATGNDQERNLKFITTIVGKRTETLNHMVSYQQFEFEDNVISNIFKELEDGIRLFLARFACDNF